MVALVHLLAGCSDDSSGPTAREGANPGGVCEDQDEPGDVDENDEEDDDGDEDDDECEDDD
jgi:hypothetical protein